MSTFHLPFSPLKARKSKIPILPLFPLARPLFLNDKVCCALNLSYLEVLPFCPIILYTLSILYLQLYLPHFAPKSTIIYSSSHLSPPLSAAGGIRNNSRTVPEIPGLETDRYQESERLVLAPPSYISSLFCGCFYSCVVVVVVCVATCCCHLEKIRSLFLCHLLYY